MSENDVMRRSNTLYEREVKYFDEAELKKFAIYLRDTVLIDVPENINAGSVINSISLYLMSWPKHLRQTEYNTIIKYFIQKYKLIM